MFTGIIERTGRVLEASRQATGLRLVIDPGPAAWAGPTPKPGDSVAVDGCCLTLAPGADTAGQGGRLGFNVVGQTLEKTTLGAYAPGRRVNLEAAMTAATPLGGHLVQGHIDAVGQVLAIQANQADHRVRVAVPREFVELLVPQGSITVDGVSLTLATVDAAAGWFEVALIPTTLQLTNLAERQAGDAVNLESDMIVRAVVHVLRLREGRPAATQPERGMTLATLAAAGFAK